LSATKDQKAMADHITCLSMLENNTALLYNQISNKVQHPLAKSLLLSIAQDSSKHSILLKGVGDSISASKVKEKDCKQNLGKIWITVSTLLDEVQKNEEKPLHLTELYEKLMPLESSLGEEYYIFVQTQTLQFLSKEIDKLYNIDLDAVKRVFESIMNDEEHHREILATLREMSEPKIVDLDNTPLVKFQSPDNWISGR
jgi:rubrerythrin